MNDRLSDADHFRIAPDANSSNKEGASRKPTFFSGLAYLGVVQPSGLTLRVLPGTGPGATSDDACTTDEESTYHVITKFLWRRAVAVPAVLTLALGGALLSTTAANAADGMLVITSPAEGSTTTSRDVTVSGTAAPGAVINVFKDSTRSERLVQTTTDDTTGAFSAALPTYADTEPVAQSIFVDGLVGSSGFDNPQTRAFNLPAVAPAEAFSVTTPTAGQELDSRTVTFSGTGNSGSTVNVLDTNGNRLAGPAVVVDGQWSIDYSYPETEVILQSVRVVQVTGALGSGDIPLQFILPSSADFAITSPVVGSTTQTRNVDVSGTGTPGAHVNLLTDETDVLRPAPATVLDNGSWTATLIYSDTAAAPQTVFASETVDGGVLGNTQVTFTLSAVVVDPPNDVALDAPVITSPTQGQVVVGDQVTFEGTGTPDSNILLAVIPTDQLDELEAAQGDDTMAAAAEPADPADPIVVDAEGNWTVTLALTPNDYTAAAVSFLLDETGAPVLDAAGQPITSAPSADVAFSLVAAVVPAGTPATPITAPVVTPVASPSSLAYTGSEGTEAAISIGTAVLLLGTTLMVLARRRAKLATTEVAGE